MIAAIECISTEIRFCLIAKYSEKYYGNPYSVGLVRAAMFNAAIWTPIDFELQPKLGAVLSRKRKGTITTAPMRGQFQDTKITPAASSARVD